MIGHIPARMTSSRRTIDRLIDRYGAMTVLWALIRALLTPRRRRARPPDISHLSPYMRRDIGLPPEPPHVSRLDELKYRLPSTF